MPAVTRMDDSSIIRAHVFVSGRVQGVNFRAATRQQAVRHQVHGWVRNCADGRVEAIFEGPRSAVNTLVAWCRHGPRYAHVEHVDVEWQEPQGERDFRVR